MDKCDFCEKEVTLPFICNYCEKQFCSEHRLPEVHLCQGLPKEKFWYQKREKQVKRELERTSQKPSPNIPSKPIKSKKSIKKIVALLALIIIVIVILLNSQTIISAFQNLMQQSSYTKVTVVEGQIATVKFDENTYSFVKEGNVFSVCVLLKFKTFDATEGAAYEAYGIEIVVSEVHSDYIVLLVRTKY